MPDPDPKGYVGELVSTPATTDTPTEKTKATQRTVTCGNCKGTYDPNECEGRCPGCAEST